MPPSAGYVVKAYLFSRHIPIFQQRGDIIIDKTAIIVAIIAALASITSAILSVVGVRTANKETQLAFNRDLSTQLQKHQAVTDLKIENLTKEVAKHNNFAQRVPVIEEKLKNFEDDIKELKEAL